MSNNERLVALYCDERTVERRNGVVEAYRYLCARGARKFKRACNERADLEQVAAIGLIKAAQYYRLELKTPFEAYAWIMIVGELMHFVRDYERLVRIPRSLRSLERRASEAADAFVAEHQREPTASELAASLSVSVAAIEDVRAMRRSELVRGEGGTELQMRIETLADPGRGPSIDERIEVAHALDDLGERDRTIVLGTYATGLTQSELGERLGLSQSHVSKLLARALERLGRRVA
ncbi:MAG: sigma-70 family RNA polymerase sigma factor [Candidatus Eremiobacteraeota bacterium]|nr:sigma-70 family RNA polymerase sigma factor [Candidatus Eremiobacteraeota bacterium]